MGIKYQKFLSNNFFLLVLLFAVTIVVFFSYNRFIVRHDYIVGYEGNCDPVTESCFVGCEDDGCTSEYYYTKMQKYEPDLFAECGADITNCEAASMCLPEDKECSITYCDKEINGDTCATTTPEDTQNNEQTTPTEDTPLQDNNMNNSNL